jgi:predicted RNA polymerase sigma factor
VTEAAAAYREALELAGTDAGRRYLTRRLAETAGQAWIAAAQNV